MSGLARMACTLLCVVALAVKTGAAEITVKDVLELKKLGFSDQDVIEEVKAGGDRFQLTDEQVKVLKAAGAGEELIDFLRQTGQKRLTVDDVVKMAQQNKSAEEILDAIAESKPRLRVADDQLQKLTEQEVPRAVILAVQGKPLGPAELRSLAESELSVAGYTKLGAIVGFRAEPPGPQEVLALRRAGVPLEVFAMWKRPRPKTEGVGEYRHVGRRFVRLGGRRFVGRIISGRYQRHLWYCYRLFFWLGRLGLYRRIRDRNRLRQWTIRGNDR